MDGLEPAQKLPKSAIWLLVLSAVLTVLCIAGYLGYVHPYLAGRPYSVQLPNTPSLFTEALAIDAAQKAMVARGYPLSNWTIATSLTPLVQPAGTGGSPPWDPSKHKAGFFIMTRTSRSPGDSEVCIIDVKLEGNVITCLIRPQKPRVDSRR